MKDYPITQKYCEEVREGNNHQPSEFTTELEDLLYTANLYQIAKNQDAKFERLVQEHQTDERFYYHGDPIEQAAHLLAHYRSERERAMELLGAFAQDMLTNLRAFLMIVKACGRQERKPPSPKE